MSGSNVKKADYNSGGVKAANVKYPQQAKPIQQAKSAQQTKPAFKAKAPQVKADRFVKQGQPSGVPKQKPQNGLIAGMQNSYNQLSKEYKETKKHQ